MLLVTGGSQIVVVYEHKMRANLTKSSGEFLYNRDLAEPTQLEWILASFLRSILVTVGLNHVSSGGA